VFEYGVSLAAEKLCRQRRNTFFVMRKVHQLAEVRD